MITLALLFRDMPVPKSSKISYVSNGGKAAGGNPSPAVYCTAIAVARSAGKPVRTADCKATAAACWAGMSIPSVYRGGAAVTGFAGKGAGRGPSRVSVLRQFWRRFLRRFS